MKKPSRVIDWRAMRSMIFRLLLIFSIVSPALVSAQVFTLSQDECVKVEARLSETVSYHKYRQPVKSQPVEDFFVCGTDWLMSDQENGSGRQKSRIDTQSINIEDTIALFFIWKHNSVLRIVARKEARNRTLPNSVYKYSLAISSLAGKSSELVYNELSKFQKQAGCNFIAEVKAGPEWRRRLELSFRRSQVNLNVSPGGFIANPECLPMVYRSGSGQVETYRIFNITGFWIEQSEQQKLTNVVLSPSFSFSNSWAGLNREEIMLEEQTSGQEDWQTYAKRFYRKNSTSSRPPKLKPKYWHEKLGMIYETIFAINWIELVNHLVPFESNKPFPYLKYQQVSNWPWSLLFSLDQEAQKQFKPFYLGNRVAGYKVFDKNSFPETGGFTIVPGCFFLPNRLKIISINNIPEKKYRPSILAFGPGKIYPTFPGGEWTIIKYFNNILAKAEFEKGGFVTLALEIRKDGTVKNVAVREGLSPEIDAAVKEIAAKMPPWLPALQNGIPVESWTELQVKIESVAERRRIAREVEVELLADKGIYYHVEQPPQFPGGEVALHTFIRDHLKYPAIERKRGTEGLVVIQFLVGQDGKLTELELLKKLSPGIDAEALRLVKSMPAWEPGKQNGRPVKVIYRIPLRFSLVNFSAQK